VNIGLATTWFERGAALVSRAYMDTLTAGGHNVFVFARAGERYAVGNPKWDLPNVTWGRSSTWHRPTWVDWREFESWVARNRLDLLIFNEQHVWSVVIRSHQFGIPIGAYVDYYTSRTVPFFQTYDFLLCNTRRHYGVFQNHPQAFHIPWGTDCRLFGGTGEVVHPDRVTFFHSYGFDPNRKGTDIAIMAFRELTGPARLVIHGQVPLTRFPRIAELASGDGRIEVIEKEVGAPGLYHLGDVYVYPSRLEGVGLTIAEAQASGLPTITTDLPPMNEFVAHGESGRLVRAEDVKIHPGPDDYYWPSIAPVTSAMTEAMRWYVDRVAELPAMKDRARNWATSRLDWTKNSRALLGIVPSLRLTAARPVPRTVEHEISNYERTHDRAWFLGRMRSLAGTAGGRFVRGGARRLLRPMRTKRGSANP